MEAYLQSLGQVKQIDEDWKLYKESNLKFEEINYMTEIEAFELAENKLSPNRRPDADVLDNIRHRMFQMRKTCPCVCNKQMWQCECSRPYTPEEIKLRVYNEWLSHKYKYFKKNWKPNQDEGLGYMHLTFNFKPETEAVEFVLDMARITNLAIFDDCKLTYCYEYFGSKGEHPHVHMLVELNRTGTISMSTIEQKVFQDKKVKEYMSIKYQFSWAKKYQHFCRPRSVHLAYIQGHKIPSKMSQVAQDKLWRSENNLEDIYIREPKK